MSIVVEVGSENSDEGCVARVQGGDREAFAELWRRHYRAGIRVASQFTSSIDADDLVSEAFTRIYKRILAGGGPSGAFRPYLYVTIRNLASSWGAADHTVQVDDLDEYESAEVLGDPAIIALDKTLTVRAFRSLPERWQEVLWYTEVEGMDPHEVAPLLGMTANGVAALSYRAREALRKAWLQAHIDKEPESGECHWAMSRVGAKARRALSPREAARMDFHLATCAKCSIVDEEIDEVGSRLAFVLVPLFVGSGVAGAVLATLGHDSVAYASEIPNLPETIAGVAGAGALVVGAAATSGGAPFLVVGAIAIAVALGTGVAVVTPIVDAANSGVPTTQSQSVSDARAPLIPDNTVASSPLLTPTSAIDATHGSALDPALDPVLGPLNPALSPLTNPLAPALNPVLTPLAPVLNPVLTPLAPVLNPVLTPLAPVLTPVTTPVAPVLDPVTGSLTPVLTPVTTPVGGLVGDLTGLIPTNLLGPK